MLWLCPVFGFSALIRDPYLPPACTKQPLPPSTPPAKRHGHTLDQIILSDRFGRWTIRTCSGLRRRYVCHAFQLFQTAYDKSHHTPLLHVRVFDVCRGRYHHRPPGENPRAGSNIFRRESVGGRKSGHEASPTHCGPRGFGSGSKFLFERQRRRSLPRSVIFEASFPPFLTILIF